MRQLLQALFLCVLFILTCPAYAQTISLTAKNQGYYIVSVDGVDVSQHTQEREAAEAAINKKLANPASAVEYRHDYQVTVGTTATAPPAPSASLQWDAVSVAEGYKVYVGTASGQYSAVADAGNVTSFKVTGLQVGTLYYFAVTAYKGADESGKSNEVSKQF